MNFLSENGMDNWIIFLRKRGTLQLFYQPFTGWSQPLGTIVKKETAMPFRKILPLLFLSLALTACNRPLRQGVAPTEIAAPSAGQNAGGNKLAFEDLTFSLEHRGPGTEVNYIVAFEGSLFATVSVWNSKDRTIPVTVLRKDGPDQPWVVDFELPQSEVEYHARSESLAVVQFTTQADGIPLARPVTLLILGAGQWSTDSVAYPWNSSVWTRVSEGNWEKVVVPGGVFRPCDGGNPAGTRSLQAYHDPVLGRDILFIGQVSGRIHRAGYDPTAPGWLSIEPEPVFQGSGRVMSLLSTPFGLFASVSQKNLEGDCDKTPGLPEGLFRYRNGTGSVDVLADPQGAFDFVDDWPTDGVRAEDSCRGLTMLPHPSRPGEFALFGGLEDPGHLVYWENLASAPQRVQELDVLDFLASTGLGAFGRLGVFGPHVQIAPYNEFTAAADPATGEPVHLVGAYAMANASDRSSYVLVRRADESYEAFRVPSPDGIALRGTRTIIPSPWPEEPATFYLGGFDAHGGPHVATGWIIRWGPTAAPAEGGE